MEEVIIKAQMNEDWELVFPIIELLGTLLSVLMRARGKLDDGCGETMALVKYHALSNPRISEF